MRDALPGRDPGVTAGLRQAAAGRRAALMSRCFGSVIVNVWYGPNGYAPACNSSRMRSSSRSTSYSNAATSRRSRFPLRALRLARSRLGNDTNRSHKFPTRFMAFPAFVRYAPSIDRRRLKRNSKNAIFLAPLPRRKARSKRVKQKYCNKTINTES